jgi:hypothetical protein
MHFCMRQKIQYEKSNVSATEGTYINLRDFGSTRYCSGFSTNGLGTNSTCYFNLALCQDTNLISVIRRGICDRDIQEILLCECAVFELYWRQLFYWHLRKKRWWNSVKQIKIDDHSFLNLNLSEAMNKMNCWNSEHVESLKHFHGRKKNPK